MPSPPMLAEPHHLQILPIAVMADEPADGVEGAARTCLDGGLDEVLGRLVLWGANDAITQRRQLRGGDKCE